MCLAYGSNHYLKCQGHSWLDAVDLCGQIHSYLTGVIKCSLNGKKT